MRFTTATAAAVLAYATAVSAHATTHGIWVNGEDQGDGRGVYIRSPSSNSPIKDLASPDLACNDRGGTPVASFASVAAGDTVTVEWYHESRSDDIIDGSHKGPILTYIAEYTDGDGVGAIWTKIDEAGYDGSTWAVEKLIANNGLYDFVMPASLAPGQYLLRQEIIAHHESDAIFTENPVRGAQFYPACIQIEVTGSGTDVPDQDFDFNTGYTYSDPGISFNLYDGFTSYDIPGPEVWTGTGSGAGSADDSPPAPTSAVSTTSSATSTTSAAPTVSSATDEPVSSSLATSPTTSAASSPASSPSTSTSSTTSPSPPIPQCGYRRRKRSSRKH